MPSISLRDPILRFLTLTSLLYLLSGCASEAEKKERRENAFDVSGGYKVRQSSGSELDMDFVIENESGRHDILVSLERLSERTQKEKGFLSQHGLDPMSVDSLFGPSLELGRGYHPEFEGGENISKDFGASSEFFVCTPKQSPMMDVWLSYCLSGKIQKQQRKMNGDLSLHWLKKEVKKDPEGQEYVEYSSDQVSLAYKTDVSQIFYKQYLGSWRGEVFLLDSQLQANGIGELKIQENPNSTFTVQPMVMASVTYGGEAYQWDASKSTEDISSLRDPNYPALAMVYTAPSGKMIALIAQIWSLGDLTGTVTYIHGTELKDLATVRLQKQ